MSYWPYKIQFTNKIYYIDNKLYTKIDLNGIYSNQVHNLFTRYLWGKYNLYKRWLSTTFKNRSTVQTDLQKFVAYIIELLRIIIPFMQCPSTITFKLSQMHTENEYSLSLPLLSHVGSQNDAYF